MNAWSTDYTTIGGKPYRWLLVAIKGGRKSLVVGSRLDFVTERIGPGRWRLTRVERGVEFQAVVHIAKGAMRVVEDLAPCPPESGARRVA